MQRARPLKRTGFLVLAMLLAGCARSTPPAPLLAEAPPADSPLTACVNPTPDSPGPIDTAIARDFAGERLQSAFSLDDGMFRAAPAPPSTQPRVSASIALCNLLAGATANNFSVIGAAAQNGMSFGLGVVTVAGSVLKTGSRSYLVGGQEQTASLQPYNARLAWIAVIEPEVAASCPAMPATPSPRLLPPEKSLPAYQILAFDADTGADGIIYSARTNALCGLPGYQPVSVAPAVEFVSVPWTLVTRGPGPQFATISYLPRSCDQRDLGTLVGTGQPVVVADETNPALVGVDLERILTACGPAVPTSVLLRSSGPSTDLPRQLVHAPVGALDVPS
jgi:hypothetical protein